MFGGAEVMNAELVEVLQSARRAAADLEVGLFAGPDALKLFDDFGRTERALAAAKARLAARVVETYAFRATGIMDEADWLARAMGSGLGEAKSVLKTIEPTVLGPSSVTVRFPVCAGFDPVAAPLNVAFSPVVSGGGVSPAVGVQFDAVVQLPPAGWFQTIAARAEGALTATRVAAAAAAKAEADA